MSICRVEFITDTEQKIVLDFSITEDNRIEFKPSYDPPIADPRINLGLAAELCQRFVDAITTTEQKVPQDELINETKSEN